MRFLIVFIVTVLFQLPIQAQNSEEIQKYEVLGQFEPESHPSFTLLSAKYSPRGDSWLRKETAQAFEAMADSARLDGISLVVVSATRNFEYQRNIWLRKWESFDGDTMERVKAIMEYVSMPGTSRHHWGTDIDINDVEPAYFETEEGQRVYAWLKANAHRFGFFQPYHAQEKGRNGYFDEEWHWSYFPLARKYLKAYNHLVEPEDITGFPGANQLRELQIIRQFVNGVVEYPGTPYLIIH